jgi:23S rRNA (uracil1939-C5)-methyltransferase
MATKQFIADQVSITGIAEKGRGVGRDPEGRVFFVENTVPGDLVKVFTIRKKKGFFEGVVQEFISPSPQRIQPFCEHFQVCGGCSWQHLDYSGQLTHKQQLVEDALLRIGKLDILDFQPILGANPNVYYRNKLEFSFSNRRWLTKEEIDSEVSNEEDVLGFHKSGAFDKAIDIHHCWLQPDPSNQIRITAKQLAIQHGLSFWDARNNTGFMRNLMLRISSLGEIMVLFSFAQDKPKKIQPFLNDFLQAFPNTNALFYCINTKVNDYLYDLDMILYQGKPTITEQLGHVRFQIGPKSFFQTNSNQAQALFDLVADYAGLSGQENVYDLYTGIGSIALYLARKARHIVGIEEIAAAIHDANTNAQLNKIHNCTFYAGDVKDILTPAFAEQHGKPDVLITDPPRAGMHPKVVQMLLELEAPRLVYVSCNPATQARDLQLLSEKYTLSMARPVDMFPHTHHVESVARLDLK